MPDFAGAERDFRSEAQFNTWTEDDIPSTLSETISASFALTRREEILDSAHRAFFDANERRAKEIEKLGGNFQQALDYGAIPRDLAADWRAHELETGSATTAPNWGFNRGWQESYEQVRQFERTYPDRVKDDATMFEEFKAESAELRKEEMDILQRGGAFGAFVGTAGAVMTDPLVVFSLPFGASAATGRSAAATIGRVAAVEGSIAMGVEIPIQAQVLRFKRELEAPWTFRDSAVNVLAAGLGGAAIAGTLTAGIEGARRALGAYRSAKEAGTVTPTEAMDEAERILEASDYIDRENPLRFTAEDGTEIKFEGPHESAVEVARSQDENGFPIDVEAQVRGLEPQDDIDGALNRASQAEGLEEIDPRELAVDAKTFQFKQGSDGAGVTDALKDVQTFDRRLAGVSIVWENKAGKRFIADGHQRVALGVRAIKAGQPEDQVRLNAFVMREADGFRAGDVRQISAIKNMAEGSGSALDAAKILREVGELGDAMLPPLPPRSALVRQARGLAQLDDDAFQQVINGVVDERFAALVGDATTDGKLQQAMIEVLRKTQPANETQARSIVAQVRTAGVSVRKTEDLFGTNQVAESLYLERAQVLDSALREARKDKATFGRLISEEGRIAETGQNRLDRAANQQRVQDAANATTQITALANSKGPISEALTDAARQVKDGATAADAGRDFLQAARRAILEDNSGRSQAGGARSFDDAAKPGEPLHLNDLAAADRPAAVQAFKAKQRALDIEGIYGRAETDQKALARLARSIAKDLGEAIEVVDPGIKLREAAAAKLTRKGLKPGELTDVVRLGFMVESPDVAARIVQRLGDQLEVVDEGIEVTGMGYVDHKALVRFPDGLVGEVQLWDPEMAKAKFGRGTELYESVRTISAEDLANDPALAARIEQAQEASKDLYAAALAAGSDEWRRAAMMILPEDMRARVQAFAEAGGSAGAPGNVSRNAARESSSPDSSTSTAEIRDQASEPSGTNRPSEPPSGVSRTTPGRNSQLKNRSAIDAPPRSIVRQAADEVTGTPEATRTGTVPDTEYEATMTQLQDLIDNQGELATVTAEVNGELVERSAANVMDELDGFEELLERIRICNVSGRSPV